MLFQDRLYGEIEIKDNIILDLINSKAIQRLKKIDQAGYYFPYDENYNQITRFEHSLGCFYLLRKFNASLEEQIFGLIHDVSHSAFSHCIDYVLDGDQEKQDIQDSIFKDFIYKTDIPEIINKHNLNLEYILDEKNFLLQENNIPDLCADRIDYSLRTLISLNMTEKEDVLDILNKIKSENNRWFFEDVEIAKKYAKLFSDLNKKHYCGQNSVTMFKRVGDYLKYAIKNNYINGDDLYTDDSQVIEKINKHLNDSELEILWKAMDNGKQLIFSKENDFDLEISCKSRIIDPLIKINNNLVHLSEIDNEWEKHLKEELKPKRYFIKNIEK